MNAKWNWSRDSTDDNPFYSNPTANIGAAMAKQPDMRVMLVGGYFDLATPFLAARYALDHGGVPPDRVTIAAFPGGHSMYDDESNLKQAVADIRRFLGHLGLPTELPRRRPARAPPLPEDATLYDRDSHLPVYAPAP